MDLQAICEAKTALKRKYTSVQLSLGTYPHLPLATLIYTDLSLGALLGTRKARHALRVVGQMVGCVGTYIDLSPSGTTYST
jgi:hypothetical protein